MAYKNYVNKFYSQRGNRYDIEIWSKTDSSLDSVEFATGKGGFRLSYKGGDDRQDIIMPSEVTIPFIVSDADDEAFISGLLSADDKEYFVVIKRNFVLFWWGNLNAGFDAKENNYYPYISTIKANDFLGEIVNDRDYSTITDLEVSIAKNTIKQYIDISEVDEWDQDVFPFGADELIFKTNLNWTAPNQLSYNDQNSVFNQFFINPQGFEGSSNYVNKYKKSDTFKEVLKAFGLKMFLADGKVYCLQPYNYVDDNFFFQNFKTGNTSTYFPVNFDTIDNRQNAESDATAATDSEDGFHFQEWILEPADFTDSIWQANGSCTSITAKSFNVALVTSNLYIDLAEGEYCVSYSENDASVYIAKEEGGSVTSLLTESGQTNFSIGAGGGELRVYTSVVGTLTIDNLSLQKGRFEHRTFLGGQAWRYDRPISIATATYPFGESSAQAISNFPNTDDTNTTESIYTSLTPIGAISTNDADLLILRTNVFYGERFDYLSAADNFTHIGGSLELKLKIGSLYLSGIPGNLSWSASDTTFTLPISISPIIETLTNYTTQSSFWYQSQQPVCRSFIADASDGYYFGPGNDGTMAFIGTTYPMALPTLSAGGDVSLQFVDATINYYINPDLSNPNVDPTPLTPVQNGLINKWFTGSAYNGIWPTEPNPMQIQINDNQTLASGIEFSASSEFNNYKRVDLGTIKLGTTGTTTTHLNAIKVLTTGPAYEVPTHLNVNNTGTNYQMTSLLLEQYIEPQIVPLEIIEGDYYVNDFSAFKSIVLKGSKYVFFEGTLTADEDVVSGSWYKMAASTETINLSDDDVIYVEDDTPPPPPPPNPHDPPLDPNEITEGITKGKNWIMYNSIGLSTTAISSADTKVDLMNNSRAKLYSGQKLIFAKPDLSHPIILTKSGDSTTSDSQIDVASFTPDVTYPAGSILAIAEFDLTNVITGGSSTPSLYKGVTTTAIYIRPNEFVVPSSSSFSMYSRDEMASVMPSSYVTRSHVYATSFVPLNYKVKAVDIYMDQNRGFTIFEGSHSGSGTTSLDTGTANTTLTLSSAWTSVEGKYVILEINFGSTDKIYGAKLTIEAV
tara:strand:- start:5919 stop:9143 length:3225 start_codon:yes stop_codon:yes gene_type:complete